MSFSNLKDYSETNPIITEIMEKYHNHPKLFDKDFLFDEEFRWNSPFIVNWYQSVYQESTEEVVGIPSDKDYNWAYPMVINDNINGTQDFQIILDAMNQYENNYNKRRNLVHIPREAT